MHSSKAVLGTNNIRTRNSQCTRVSCNPISYFVIFTYIQIYIYNILSQCATSLQPKDHHHVVFMALQNLLHLSTSKHSTKYHLLCFCFDMSMLFICIISSPTSVYCLAYGAPWVKRLTVGIRGASPVCFQIVAVPSAP